MSYLLLLFGLAAAGTASGQEPLRYTCYRGSAAPVVDGRLDDAAWRLAPWTSYLVDIEGDRKPAPPRDGDSWRVNFSREVKARPDPTAAARRALWGTYYAQAAFGARTSVGRRGTNCWRGERAVRGPGGTDLRVAIGQDSRIEGLGAKSGEI